MVITPTLTIDDHDIEERFVRASGPGGQNVNKVATAVELRFDITRSSLSEPVRARLRALAGSRVTTDDVLVIDAREYREQSRNREAARARLVELVRRAAARPRVRRPTRPTATSKVRRRTEKARTKARKASRRGVRGEEE